MAGLGLIIIAVSIVLHRDLVRIATAIEMSAQSATSEVRAAIQDQGK